MRRLIIESRPHSEVLPGYLLKVVLLNSRFKVEFRPFAFGITQEGPQD
jgi:hypothetical protein